MNLQFLDDASPTVVLDDINYLQSILSLKWVERRVPFFGVSRVHHHEVVQRDVNSNHTSEDTLRASSIEVHI
ncbi:Uncharacterized protein TCM_013626 [Theobroma cacao]|uniref:Uncharacterized protein n=1 Tax=Theobroma cacao TaxID=3641 RepID=A0A061FXR6_THECC|nr:Uncharacterized protein TCM_013626 [Theobroma cacao]